MKLRISALVALAVFTLAGVFGNTPAQAQFIQQGPKLTDLNGLDALQGFSVSLSANGDTAIIGGPGSSPVAVDVGAAWVYVRSGGVWTQQAKLVDTGSLRLGQGISVSLSADGNTAIVGENNDSNGVGAARVYTRSLGAWNPQAKLVGIGAVGEAAQGSSVSLSGDGSTAIVGGFGDNNRIGAAWVFTRSGSAWSQQAKLVATDAIGAALEGWSVSLSGDGNTAIVGGKGDNITQTLGSSGAAWVFTRSQGVWTQQAKLVGTGAVGEAAQGSSVSLSADGTTAIVGRPLDGFTGGPELAIGAAWVFTRSGQVWNQEAKLIGTGTGPAGSDVFQGRSVSLSGDGNIAFEGGNNDNGGIGAAWVFTRALGVWTQQGSKLVNPDLFQSI
jgi:hypothetical protein